MDALSITTEQAIAQTSQSLQLQSIAFNTKRVILPRGNALLELVREDRAARKDQWGHRRVSRTDRHALPRQPDNRRADQWVSGAPAPREKKALHQ